MFLADEGACPDVVNKWECLFLPATSCPWPDVVLNCHSEGCLPIDERGFLSSLSPDGQIIKESEFQAKISSLPLPKREKAVIAAPMYQSKDPANLITAETSWTQSRGGGDQLESHFLYGVVTRFNAKFRELVQEVMVSGHLKSMLIMYISYNYNFLLSLFMLDQIYLLCKGYG